MAAWTGLADEVETWPRLNDDTRTLLRRNEVQQLDLRWRDIIDFSDRLSRRGRERCERDGLLLGQCTSLKRVGLTDLNTYDRGTYAIEAFDALLRGLSRNRSIQYLYLEGYGPRLHEDELGIVSVVSIFSILSTFLEHNRNLHCLELAFPGGMFNEGHRQLVPALQNCPSLRDFVLNCVQDDADEYGGEIITALQNGRNKNLRRLSLVECCSSWNGCAELGSLIQNSTLTELNLSENEINDDGAALLGRILSGKTSLKILRLSDMYQEDDETPSITPEGWIAFFSCLNSPNCALEELDVQNNEIDDESSLALADALAGNKTLKTLNFRGNSNLSVNGWCSFFTKLLHGPTSALALEKLNVRSCGSTDVLWEDIDGRWEIADNNGVRVASTLGAALSNNKALKTLDLAGFEPLECFGGRKALFASLQLALLNNESLSTTISSNHSLSRLVGLRSEVGMRPHRAPPPIPDDLESLFELNNNKDKDDVVRQKVLRYFHFGNPDPDEVVDLEWSQVLPHALSWAGRDCLRSTLFFRLVRRVPELFNSTANRINAGEKRKACYMNE